MPYFKANDFQIACVQFTVWSCMWKRRTLWNVFSYGDKITEWSFFFILVWALGWLMSQVQTAFSQENHLPFWATRLSSDKTKHKLEELVSESHNGILTRSLLRANFLWWEWVNPNFEFVHPFPWTSLCLHKISVSSLLTAVKNQVTGNFILNEKSEDAKSKTFIENGLQWEYSIEGERETLKTTGPLHEGIIVLVSVSSKFSELQFVLPNFCLF